MSPDIFVNIPGSCADRRTLQDSDMMITLYKTDNDKSMLYYTIHDRQYMLFKHHGFITLWGNSYNSGREKSYTFTTRYEMNAKIRELMKKRIEQGYRVLYGYSRDKDISEIIELASNSSA